MLTKQCWTVLLTLSLVLTTAALAQQPSLVTVDVTDVRAEIAKSINVDVNQIPRNVRVPVDVAANVCGVAVDVLTQQMQQGTDRCKAKSTSSALNSAVQEHIKKAK
ncbi:MAG: hypothetical protein L0Z53_05610 [Acidobacteriales bacterium]|nr:hypothetical protein [Terriglobales bacterium]